MGRNLELLQLQYFQMVARLEHMTKAAEKLNIAQPALSQSISRLENDLGVPLFDRKGRKIRLNAYGKIYLEKVEIALKALEEGRRELAERAGIEKGSIYMVASTFDRLSRPLNAYLDKYPDVNFRISQASMEKMTSMIDNPDIDFCFTAIPIDRPDIESIPVLTEEVFLGVPPGHRLAERGGINLNEAAQEHFINYRKGHQLRKMNDAFCHEAGFSPQVVCEAEEPTEIANLVRAGLGVAFVGTCKLDDDLIKLRIKQPLCQRRYELVWQKNRYLSRAATHFKSFLIDYFSS